MQSRSLHSNILFISCRVNINYRDLWVSVKMIKSMFCVCFPTTRVYCGVPFLSPLTALFRNSSPPPYRLKHKSKPSFELKNNAYSSVLFFFSTSVYNCKQWTTLNKQNELIKRVRRHKMYKGRKIKEQIIKKGQSVVVEHKEMEAGQQLGTASQTDGN